MDELACTPAIQDQLPDQPCWGCGQANPHGLRIKSHWSGDQSVCTWRPEADHVGWPGVLNGGILAAIVDCHCVCTALADAYRAEGRALNSQPPVAFATGSLNVMYLKPVPIDAPVELYARITERTARKTRLECVVVSGGEQRARADVVAVRLAVPLATGV
jgi:acyl-coenzyme A thioesterase PaaI-like protein